MEKDITKDLEKEEHVELLSETAERLSSTLVFLSATDSGFEDWLGSGIFILENQGKITYVNYAAAQMYKSILGKDPLGQDFFFKLLNCESLDSVIERLKNPCEITILQNTYLFQSHPLFSYGDMNGCVVSYQDITNLRRKEQELNAQSTIIREIHHRVKNNLQSVASLLRLQARRSNSELVQTEFAASINRIMTIATVHEVFALQSWDKIDLIKLSQRLMLGLVESFLPSEHEVETMLEGDQLFLCSNKAVPLALVINELLTNSLKYGVSKVKKGKLKMSISENNHILQVTVEDNGPGFLFKSVPDRGKHLGLQIVDSLIRDQLRGTFTIERVEGMTRATIAIPN